MMYWVGMLAVAAIPLLLVWVYELYKRGESARRRAYKYLGATLDLEEENERLRLELHRVLNSAIERGELLGYDNEDGYEARRDELWSEITGGGCGD